MKLNELLKGIEYELLQGDIELEERLSSKQSSLTNLLAFLKLALSLFY